MMNEKQKEQFNLVMNVGRLISMITLTVFAVFGMSKLDFVLVGVAAVVISWIPKRMFRKWFTNGLSPEYKEKGEKVIDNLKIVALTLMCVYAIGGVYVCGSGLLVIAAIAFMTVPRFISEWTMNQDD